MTVPKTIKQPRFRTGQAMCAYCGSEVSSQREDPIPRNLYPSHLRSTVQLLKIPACATCNVTKSQFDNFLRDFLVIDIDSGAHPVAAKVFDEKMISAVIENHVRLLDEFYGGFDVVVGDRTGSHLTLGYAVKA